MAQFTDVLIMDTPPKEKPTDHIWPTKRQKMLLKYLGHDVDNMSVDEVQKEIKSIIKKFCEK